MAISISSLELLKKYRPSFSRLTTEKIKMVTGVDELSTEEVVRVAAACFIRRSSPLELDNPFSCLLSSGLTRQETKSVELTVLLLTAAKNVSNQNYELATNLLTQCFRFSSSTGNPLERVIYYFSQALIERIEKETGLRVSGSSGEAAMKSVRSNDPTQLGVQQKLPFSQLVHFISVQTIIDNVASSKRIHTIDISVKHGLQWIALMQALATRSASPIEYLKISAVGESEEAIDSTGKMLASFAKTLHLPFTFKAVVVADMRELKKEMLGVEEGEAVAVYSSMDMSTMIVKQDGLENLMRVLRTVRPCVMTVADVEGRLNSPSFTVRFTEALFYFSSTFDYLGEYMEGSDKTRMTVEGELLSQGIMNIVAREGSERVVRYVGVSVWRSFFERFRVVEEELNEWSLYQANLIVQQFPRGDSCSFEKNGESIILGWKGRPLLFVSAWKFL